VTAPKAPQPTQGQGQRQGPLDLDAIQARAAAPIIERLRTTWAEYHAEIPNEAPAGFGQNVAQLNRVAFIGERAGALLESQADVPALVAELRAARTFRDDIRAALRPGRWRGFDGPDGVSKDEVVADVAAALAAHDQAASGQVPR